MKKKILIVEDDPRATRLKQMQLKHLGYSSIVAMNGKQALDMAVAQLPDLITLAMTLPDMDGLEVARCIRQNPETHAIPILATTQSFTPQEQDLCLGADCDDYISKPYTSSLLALRIKTLLNQLSTEP